MLSMGVLATAPLQAEAGNIWYDLLTRFGLPTALILLFLWVMYRDVWPWFKRLTEAQLSRMVAQADKAEAALASERERMAGVMEEQTRALQTIADGMRVLYRQNQRISGQNKRILEGQAEIAEALQVITAAERRRQEYAERHEQLDNIAALREEVNALRQVLEGGRDAGK